VGADGNVTHVNDRLLQNKIVGYKVKANVKQAVGPATSSIAEGLQVENSLKWRIEEINRGKDGFPY